MLKIYSEIDKNILLSIMRKNEVIKERQDMSPPEEFLQVGAKKLSSGDYFKPHYHLACNKIATITQEAWVILKGQARGIFYDLDEKLIYETTLEDGDCVVIFRGGHALKCLTDDTVLYEFKTGPYYGPQKDKAFLGAGNEQ